MNLLSILKSELYSVQSIQINFNTNKSVSKGTTMRLVQQCPQQTRYDR